jgi:K(+)-stimulated pyrophosphate-energized sodium pump
MVMTDGRLLYGSSPCGGGKYTKPPTWARPVGKVEAGIPEDDPRNPATIRRNVATTWATWPGKGADLYESYFGSGLATLL